MALGCARIFFNITMLLQFIPQSKYLAQKLSGDIPKNIYTSMDSLLSFMRLDKKLNYNWVIIFLIIRF